HQVMEQRHVDPKGSGHPRVKRTDLKLLVKGYHHQQVDEKHDPHGPKSFRADSDISQVQKVPRDVGNLPVENVVEIEVNPSCKSSEKHHSQGEKGRKGHPGGRVPFDAAPVERLHHHGGEEAKDQGAYKHGDNTGIAGDEKGQHDTQQDGVADGITQEGHAS